MANIPAIKDKKYSTLTGIPKMLSNLARMVIRNKAVNNAPKQSIRKSLLGFNINFSSIN